MAAKKAAVAAHTAPKNDPKEVLHREGTAMRTQFAAERRAVVEASAAFNRRTVAYLRAKSPETQAAFVKGMVEEARVVLQPWAMEILYVVGLVDRARFTELQRLLGVSSRVLSDKLQDLRQAGLVDRQVYDEHPVRIEYFLTKRGARVALLGSPLFCELDAAVTVKEPAKSG